MIHALEINPDSITAIALSNGHDRWGLGNEFTDCTVAKSGNMSAMPLSKKNFGAITGLKASKLRSQHAEYRLEYGKALNAFIASEIAKGNMLAQRMGEVGKGKDLSVKFMATSKVAAAAEAPVRSTTKAKLAEKDSEIAALKAMVEALSAKVDAATQA